MNIAKKIIPTLIILMIWGLVACSKPSDNKDENVVVTSITQTEGLTSETEKPEEP